ncbi:unnamed protein product [Closterium sp. NIES-64]|nr:unnamed protein product [Closterium sp. NIES-64]
MDTSDAEGDAADPDDRPTCITPLATGLQFLRAVHADNACDEELADGGTEWMRRPGKESGGMEDVYDDWYPSPRPTNDAAESDGVEEWIASPRNEVAAEPAEPVATQVVDAATPESTCSVASKKRRYTQQVLQWGTPPPKPDAPPPPAAPPPILPLTDKEKKEKAYLKAQKSYKSDWLPKFDWLILDKTPEGDPLTNLFAHMSVRQVEVTQVTEEVDRVVSLIEHRYIDYDGGFGAGLSPFLSPFMARVKRGDNMVKVDGVDASGIPVKHTFELSELADKKHTFGGTLADCVKLGKAFAREVVYNLKHRMRDLRRMGGLKLFRVDKWPANPDTRVRRCATWLREKSKLFNHQLPDVVDIWRKQKKRRPTKSPAPFQPANDKGGPEASSDDEREDDVA